MHVGALHTGTAPLHRTACRLARLQGAYGRRTAQREQKTNSKAGLPKLAAATQWRKCTQELVQERLPRGETEQRGKRSQHGREDARGTLEATPRSREEQEEGARERDAQQPRLRKQPHTRHHPLSLRPSPVQPVQCSSAACLPLLPLHCAAPGLRGPLFTVKGALHMRERENERKQRTHEKGKTEDVKKTVAKDKQASLPRKALTNGLSCARLSRWRTRMPVDAVQRRTQDSTLARCGKENTKKRRALRAPVNKRKEEGSSWVENEMTRIPSERISMSLNF